MKNKASGSCRMLFICYPVLLLITVPVGVFAQKSSSSGYVEISEEGKYIRKLREPMGFALNGEGTIGGERGVEVMVT